MSNNVIALSGWKLAGKDTMTEYLVEEYGYTRKSFADPLKEQVARTYDIPLEYTHTPSKKEMPLSQYPVIAGDPFGETIHHLLRSELRTGFWTPRALCILEGSIKRSVYSNYWVASVVKEILASPDKKYVISDMRYKSEADTLKLFIPTLTTVRIERTDSIETTDPSERNLDDYVFDHKISNRSTVGTFHDNIDRFLSLLAVGRR